VDDFVVDEVLTDEFAILVFEPQCSIGVAWCGGDCQNEFSLVGNSFYGNVFSSAEIFP